MQIWTFSDPLASDAHFCSLPYVHVWVSSPFDPGWVLLSEGNFLSRNEGLVAEVLMPCLPSRQRREAIKALKNFSINLLNEMESIREVQINGGFDLIRRPN